MQDHTAETIKSLEGFDLAWIEEAQSLSQRSLDLLRPTIRKAGSELWASWNPRDKTDPVDEFFRGAEPPPDSILVRCGYEDNPYLPDVLRREIEWDLRRDPEKHAHVWGGEYASLSEARVFRNWTVEDFDTPHGAALYHGGDWGFAVDPSVLIRMFLADKKLYISHEAFAVGCEIDNLPALFDSLECGEACGALGPKGWDVALKCGRAGHGSARKWTITADSSRPETISYMRHHGYPRIEPARKGPNSVEEGVEFLKSYDIVVHPRCKRTIQEFRSYSYKVDPRTQQVMPLLKDEHNHAIDSARYGVERIRKPLVRVGLV